MVAAPYQSFRSQPLRSAHGSISDRQLFRRGTPRLAGAARRRAVARDWNTVPPDGSHDRPPGGPLFDCAGASSSATPRQQGRGTQRGPANRTLDDTADVEWHSSSGKRDSPASFCGSGRTTRYPAGCHHTH